MAIAVQQPIYDPAKTFEDNFENGPFGLFASSASYKEEGAPKYTFLGYPVNLPFGIAAGSLPNSRFIKGAFNAGFDVVCYKTQRTVPFSVNEFPNVISIQTTGDVTLERAEKGLVMSSFGPDPSTYTITNSFGNPSRGPQFWVDDLAQAVSYAHSGQLLIISVVGTIQDGFTPQDYYEDFAKAAEMASGTGVHAIELNLSCPNVASESVICYTPEAVIEICQRTRSKIGNKPLIIKLGYFTHEQQALLEGIIEKVESLISAISAINTIPAAVYDENGKQALPGEGRLKSGLCGAGVKWAGLDMVKRLDELRQKKSYKYEIIGVGGVMTPEDYHKYRNAGADCVQSVTGAMWNPNLAYEIKESISQKN